MSNPALSKSRQSGLNKWIRNQLKNTRVPYDVIALEELASGDRFMLEHACRAQVQPVYLGGYSALCRILGRYKVDVDTRDEGFGSNVLLDGFWEMWLTMAIARKLKPGMIAIDIGANFGYYSLLMADLVGAKGTLIAVEPNAHVAPKLRSSLALNGFAGRSRVLEAAAAASDEGSARLYSTIAEPKNATIVSKDFAAAAALANIADVPNWTPAAVLREFGRIDFIKIDAEGAEENILAGIKPLLGGHRPDIVLEFNAARYEDAPAFLADLAECYGEARLVAEEGSLAPIARKEILTRRHGEDWLLYFSRRI
jgi:FkbM family methyltransferase